MALAYRPPGVSVEELTTPNVSPLLATPASIGLIGLAQGYIERTDQIKLTGTTAVSLVDNGTLPAGSTLVSVLSVKDPFDPGHAPNLDGTYRGPVNGVTGSGQDFDLNLASQTITRHAADTPNPGDGLIPDGRIVAVTYRYVPSDYYEATFLTDLGSVESRYGAAWLNGAIFSDLSYAAGIAFENGAQFVVCQPVFARATPGNPDTAKVAAVVGGASGGPANAGAFANPSTWGDTFYSLRDIEDINVFVPLIGQSADRKVVNATWLAIVQAAQDHLKFLKGEDQYGIVIAGEDGTTSSVISGEFPTKATIRNDVATLASRYGSELAEDTALVNTSKFTRQRPDAVSGTITVGGQYMAAALAGMLASAPISTPLTRRQVSGFVNLADYRSKQDKNDDAGAGLLVIDQKGLAITVRHAVTTDTSASQKRELSVVRAKHYTIESLRGTIDSQVIGKVIADATATTTIKTVVISVLEQMKAQRAMVDYFNVDVRQLTTEPTTIEVRFSYLPSFPVNYVNIVFSIDLASGTVNTNITGQ